MTTHEFIAKWRSNELKERSASQSHFNDLCALLGVVDPITADPAGEWFAFEMAASKTSGGEGWADVWRKACFAWEYKGLKKDLKKAFDQLLQYSVGLENPPLKPTVFVPIFAPHPPVQPGLRPKCDLTGANLTLAPRRGLDPLARR